METIEIADGFKGEKAIVIPSDIREYKESNEITAQLYVTEIGYFPNAKYHFRRRTEGFDENILIYCEKGRGWIECSGDRYVLSDNQAFIVPALRAHSYGADGCNPWSIYWIHFRGRNVRMFDSIIGRQIFVGDSPSSRYHDRITLFEEIYQNLETGYGPDNLEYVSFCLMHFLASLKYLPQFREIKNVKEEDIVQKSIHYMKDNLGGKITLGDIADAVGYSGSRLTTLFSRRMSVPPMVYYHQLKILRACSFLQLSDMKIKEIAFRLGYYDPFHFSNSFTKETGLTPKEYRNRYREDPEKK